MRKTEGGKLRKVQAMHRLHAQDGFSLVEIMIAVVILTWGLSGAAALQINAMRGAFSASSYSTGAGLSQAWIEWFSGLISQKSQQTTASSVTNDTFVTNNFFQLANLDANPHDDKFTVLHPFAKGGNCSKCPDYNRNTDQDCIEFKQTTADIKAFLNTHHFTPAVGEGTFDDASRLPSQPAPGSYMVWRIAANMPTEGVTTVQVSVKYTNAFVTNRGSTLTIVLGSNN
jgi:prepilin-type N-terminal cleavage/methylation domain-containing protein